jgi:uncharacterized membrane protein YbjE (DUF340 family)
MSNKYQERLQAEVDAVLKGLPQRTAPRTLLPRVMAAIQSRAVVPWYRQSWQMWPAVLRAVSLVILLSLFAGLCLAGWKLLQADAYTSAVGHLGQRFSGICALWNVLSALFGAVLAMAKQLPAGFIAACLVSLGLGYGLCIGLGAAWMRLALGRR